MLFEHLHHRFDCLFELRIVAFAHQLGVHHHFDIGRDAIVFDLPFALQPVNGPARGRHASAVQERGISADANQPAPSALTDNRADPELAEIPGQGIAAGANWTSNFVVSLTFLELLHLLGPSWTFCLYGLLALGAWPFSYYHVPETKGRTFEEIEGFWQRKR